MQIKKRGFLGSLASEYEINQVVWTEWYFCFFFLTFSSLSESMSLFTSDWSCVSLRECSAAWSSRRCEASVSSVSSLTFSSCKFRSSFRSDINCTVSWFSWSSSSCLARSNRSAVRRFPASSAWRVAIWSNPLLLWNSRKQSLFRSKVKNAQKLST